MRDEASSALVCLDLQQGRLRRATDGELVARACGHLLAEARRRGWPVLHVHGRTASSEDLAAIRGLEPRPSEPVYARFGPSAFSNRRFAESALALGGPLALVGFDLADTVLATAFAAADRGAPVDLIRDAVGCGGRDDLAALLCAPLPAFAPRVRVIASQDLLNERAPRLAAANLP
jgi:nicotinamidase-related amidase